jgi:hypothetical protein
MPPAKPLLSLDELVTFACTQGTDPRHLRLVLGMYKLEEMKMEDPCGIAAWYGNLTILALLRNHGIPWGRSMERAVQRNQIHVKSWMFTNGYRMDKHEPTGWLSTSPQKSLAYRRAALLNA